MASSNSWIQSRCKSLYLDQPEKSGGKGLTWCADAVTEKNAYETTLGSIGAEVALWGETIVDTADVTDRLYPRLIAFAEASWSPTVAKNYAHFALRRASLEGYLLSDVSVVIDTTTPEVTVSLGSENKALRLLDKVGSIYDVLGRELEGVPPRGRYIRLDEDGVYRVRGE